MRNLLVLAMALLVCGLSTSGALGQVGRRLASEKKTVTDAVTGFSMTVLTSGAASDAKIYPTHRQWTSDGAYIIFRSSGRAPQSQAYAAHEESGEIIQLTEGRGNLTGSLNVARKAMMLYFLRNATAAETAVETTLSSEAPSTTPAAATRPARGEGIIQLIELDLTRLLADSKSGNVAAASTYERICATLPRGVRDSGGFGLDADERFAYIGVRGGDVGQHLPGAVTVQEKPAGARMGAGPGGLRSINLKTGEIKVIIDTPFQMGHVQTNPYVSGEIVYCHETGGDAPQRMWTVRADGTGNRPLYEEHPLEWVTHEAVVGPDEVMFNLIGHQKRLRARPTGIAVINLRTNVVQLLGQIDERGDDPNDLGANAAGSDAYGGFWHCNGSPDGRWAVGDTFHGDIWLIERASGKRTRLSTGHRMRPDHAHPSFDDRSSRILIQSGKFTDGQRLSLVVIPIPKELHAEPE